MVIIGELYKKVKVVYNKKTGKMIPFEENNITGEVIILTTGAYNPDDTIVGMVDIRRLDLLNGYVLPEGVTSVEE
jgi:hypothetical protein